MVYVGEKIPTLKHEITECSLHRCQTPSAGSETLYLYSVGILLIESDIIGTCSPVNKKHVGA